MAHIDTTIAWTIVAILAAALLTTLLLVQAAIVRHRRRAASAQLPARTGTVFLLADESGSTLSATKTWMHGLAIDLLERAGAAGRDFVYVGFSHVVEAERVFHFPHGHWDADRVSAMTEDGLRGGTNYDHPLRMVADHLATGARDVDVVIFTDGFGSTIQPSLSNALVGARFDQGAQFHIVLSEEPLFEGDIECALDYGGLSELADTSILIDTTTPMRDNPVSI